MGGGGNLAQPGAGRRECADPAAAPPPPPTAPTVDGGVNRPSAGENPAASGLGGDSPPVTRFLGNGQAP
jgi:hypothetical protein